MTDNSLRSDADRPDHEQPVAHLERRHRTTLGEILEATLADPSDISPQFDELRLATKDTDGVEHEAMSVSRLDVVALANELGWEPTHPPTRNFVGALNAHVELADFGEHVRFDTPTTEFSIRLDRESGGDESWVIREHDAGESMVVDRLSTKAAALGTLLDSAGVTGHSEEGR